MGVIVAIMTAFYTFRMIGMSFFGNESKHLKEIEQSGHHLHEVSASLWIPFAILAVATISIGVVGFAFEAEIHSLLGGYLLDSFGIGEKEHRNEGLTSSQIQILPKGEKSFFGLNPIAAIASIGAFSIGAVLGFIFYIARKADPEIISRNIVTKAIWKFLYNRWYLNSALYWGAVIGPLAIYRIIWRYFESAVIDGINPALQYSMTYVSKVVKSGQTGITQTYLFVFGVGIMIVVIMLLLL
jgi:NADH-quinone oxidoreductase subunit L